MKWVRRIGIAVVIIVVVVLVALYFSINSIIAGGVEQGGDMVLGPNQTHLGSANLSLTGSSLSLSDLELDNPEQFGDTKFLGLTQADVNVSLGTLMDEKVVIPQVTLDGLHVTAETTIEKLPPRLNLIMIKKQIDEALGPAGPSDPADEAAGKKFVIEKLTVTNMKVTGALTMPGKTRVPINVKVPPFTIEGIGEKSNGVVMREMVGIILKAVLGKAIEAVGQVGGIGLDAFEGGAEALKNIGGGLLKGAGDAGGNVGEAVGGMLQGIGGNKNADQSDDTGDGADADDQTQADDPVGGALRGVGGMLGGNKDNDTADDSSE